MQSMIGTWDTFVCVWNCFQSNPKDEFYLNINSHLDSKIPPTVLKRVSGKQKPLAPHAYRLLAAAHKDPPEPKAKAAPKSKASATPKAKGHGKGRKGGKGGKSGKGVKKSKKGKGTEPKEKSQYAIAKATFIAELFLVQKKSGA